MYYHYQEDAKVNHEFTQPTADFTDIIKGAKILRDRMPIEVNQDTSSVRIGNHLFTIGQCLDVLEDSKIPTSSKS